jgi:hypothetical protein
MTTIQKGTAMDVGTKFWDIRDATHAAITAFNHDRFPHILSGAEVYFVNLDIDPGLSENVQIAADVDGEIKAATASAGITDTAEAVLRDYVMRALLNALGLQGPSRSKYLKQLRHKMAAIRSDAEAEGSKVTIAILKANGIS